MKVISLYEIEEKDRGTITDLGCFKVRVYTAMIYKGIQF